MKINKKVLVLKEKINILQQKIKNIQDNECLHENVIKKHGSNTGNYDPTSDRYWIDFKCPDCLKQWCEDQEQYRQERLNMYYNSRKLR